jgi:hypothetical protein
VAFWLVYEIAQPRELVIRIVESNEATRPEHSLNGPCVTAQEILERMTDFFEYDAEGFVHLKVAQDHEND